MEGCRTRLSLSQQARAMVSNEHIKHHKNQLSNHLDSNSMETGDDRQTENGSINYEKPRGRGATRMARVWERKTQKEVHFNKLGQPVGPNKGEFVEFLGTMVRNGSLVPLDAKSWLKVPQSIKRAMIDVLKEKFVLHPGFEAWALKSLGKKWRNWKNRVKGKYFDPKASLEQNLSRRPDSDDERVLPEQWKNLVIFWDSIEARSLSVKNKEHRALRKMNHRTGKKSSAQVADEMNINIPMAEEGRDSDSDDERDDVMDDDPTDYEASRDEIDDVMDDDDPTDYEGSRTDHFTKSDTRNWNASNPVVSESLRKKKVLRSDQLQRSQDKDPNDISSKVIQDGVERALMFGFGVSPSDIRDTMPSPTSCNGKYKNEIEKLMNRVNEQDKQINELMMNMQRDRNVSPPQVHGVLPSSSTPLSATNHQPTLTISSMPLRVLATVSLKSMLDPSKVVAIGRIESLGPSDVPGQIKLGKNWCEVKVNIALEVDEELIRPIYECTTIGEVVGKSIAWPIHLVALVKDW